MPLSEHEQRLLEQLERALQDEDPKFASALQGSRLRARLRLRLVTAVIGVLLGLAAVGYGVSSRHVALEVAGALVAAGCVLLAWTAWRRIPAPGEIVPATKLRKLRRARDRAAKRQGTFMQRMELRWQHRRERDQF